jgi:hypothetical protein
MSDAKFQFSTESPTSNIASHKAMSLEEARAVLWLRNDYRYHRPMGELWDEGYLNQARLEWASKNAYDPKIKQAAIVMLASMKQARPTATSQIPVSNLVSMQVLPLEAGMTLERARATLWPFGEFRGQLMGTLVIAIFSGIAWLLLYMVNWSLERLQTSIENYRKGQEGEERVVEVMRQRLDGNWMLFRNVTLPGRNKADIDAVLVGPPGVWALEIKTFTGEYRNIGEQWEYRAGRQWKLRKPSPSRQVRDNAVRFAEFLKADGIKQWIDPVILWAGCEDTLSVENPSVAVWTLTRLPEELGNLGQGKTIPEAERTRIIEKLIKLYQEPGAEGHESEDDVSDL